MHHISTNNFARHIALSVHVSMYIYIHIVCIYKHMNSPWTRPNQNQNRILNKEATGPLLEPWLYDLGAKGRHEVQAVLPLRLHAHTVVLECNALVVQVHLLRAGPLGEL